MVVHGVDLYERYQRVTSWPAARKAGKQFVWMKVGEGVTTRGVAALSPAAAKGSGVYCGAYWYARPGSAVQQANMLVNRAETLGLTQLAPALDLEDPFRPNKTAVNFAVAFCRQIVRRGHRPALYGNNTMLRTVATAVKRAVPSTIIWAARYGATPTVAFEVWQHSQYGHVPGIAAGSVDLNKGSIPYNVQGATKEADVPLTNAEITKIAKAVWSADTIPINGANGKPLNAKNPDWWAQNALGATVQNLHAAHRKLDATGHSVWSERVPVVGADGKPRDPDNPDWWASSVLATCLQHVYGLHEKIDTQQAQIDSLIRALNKIVGEQA